MHGFTLNGKYMLVLFEMMHAYDNFLLLGCKCKWELESGRILYGRLLGLKGRWVGCKKY